MQYSLDRLLELFEARFGRRLTNILIGLVCLAVAVFSVNIIVNQGIIPVYNFASGLIRDKEFSFSARDALALLISGVVPGMGFLIAYRLFLWRPWTEHT